MKLTLVLPWLCVLGLVAGLAALYSDNQKKENDLTVLREANQQLEQLRAQAEASKTNQTESGELVQLRKDHEDLLRLRNDVRQLRDEKQQLTRQLQTAQAQTAQAQAPRPTAAPAPPTLSPEQQALAARYGLNLTPEQAAANVCLNNLRMIDAAKQQWALEHGKPTGTLLTAADLAPYLKTNVLPACPAGGVYTLNPVGLSPICSIPGHALPK